MTAASTRAPVSIAGPYRDQSASELRLRLHRGPLPTAALRVLECGSLATEDWRLSAHIIGASHWLRFDPKPGTADLRRARASLHEVFACAELDARGRLARARAGESLRLAIPHESGRFEYRFDSRVIDGPRGHGALRELECRLEACGSSAASFSLSHCFPADSGQASRFGSPRTLLGARCREGSIEVETAHVYSNEDRVVLSHTKLSPVGEGRG